MNSERPPFARTSCACDEDVANCKTQPGMLLPSDIAPILTRLVGMGVDAREYLVASPGAVFARIAPEGIIGMRVETITPAQDEAGHCKFLTASDRCAIHDVAPVGCAGFDVHMSKAEADRRSIWVHSIIALDPDYARFRKTLKLK